MHTSDFSQSKPNFHTWLLTRLARLSSKMGITGHMQPPLIGGFCTPPPKKKIVDTITLERLNQFEPNFHTLLLTGIARPSSKMGIAGHM